MCVRFGMQMHPVELARQVTLLEFDLFRQIAPSELVGLAWMKADKQRRASNLLRMIDFSNRVRFTAFRSSLPLCPLLCTVPNVDLDLHAVLLLVGAESDRSREPRRARRRLLPRVRPPRRLLPAAQLLRHCRRRQRARVLRRLPARALLRHGLQGTSFQILIHMQTAFAFRVHEPVSHEIPTRELAVHMALCIGVGCIGHGGDGALFLIEIRFRAPECDGLVL